MSIQRKFVANGMAPRLAQVVGGTVATGLSAAGSNQGTAVALSSDDFQVFSTVGGGQGCIFATLYAPMDRVWIANGGAHTLLVYPASGGQINNAGANAGLSLSSGTLGVFVSVDGLNWWGGTV